MQFDNLDQYLKFYETNPVEGAAVPPSLVADYYGVGHASIMRKLKEGKLDEIKIGGTRLVAISSLLAEEKKFNKQCSIVRKALEKIAREGRDHVFYEEIMTPINLSTKVPADRGLIGKILGKISEESHSENKTLLSVLVHRKTSGQTIPGPGFFDLADSLGFEWDDNDEFVISQTKNVLRHYKA